VSVDLAQQQADLAGHHIEGYARAAAEAGRPADFSVPLISHIEDNLWMGGCKNGVRLPDDFAYVLSLYPWEQYTLGPDTQRLEVRLYDSSELPPTEQLFSLADVVNREIKNGKVLVHCQAGLNRSALITALALVTCGFGRPASSAIALLRKKRCPVVLCNEAFESWLLALDRPVAA